MSIVVCPSCNRPNRIPEGRDAKGGTCGACHVALVIRANQERDLDDMLAGFMLEEFRDGTWTAPEWTGMRGVFADSAAAKAAINFATMRMPGQQPQETRREFRIIAVTVGDCRRIALERAA